MLKVIAVLVLCVGMKAWAQSPNKIPIYVQCSCADPVGIQYASALRDVIAKSPRYILASSGDKPKDANGKVTGFNWVMHIVTMDDNPGENSGLATAISIVLTINEIDFGQYVQVCGASKVQTCAERALGMVDNTLNAP